MADSSAQKHCVVLVVDDTSDTREMLRALLEMNGYKVQVAGNGAEALSALTQQRFDAVVTDMWMPEMTGAQFVVAARDNPSTRGLHIVMMSGAFDQGFPTGVDADEFLKKPLDIQSLLDILNRLRSPSAD